MDLLLWIDSFPSNVLGMLKEKLNEINAIVKEIFLANSFVQDVAPRYLREALLAYPSREGKSLRPALLMWCCGLFDERIEKTAKIAAAVELYHIWTLVHDDIIDNDDYRRKGASVHTFIRDQCCRDHKHIVPEFARQFGIDLAILCGDIQQAWANNLILQSTEDGITPDIVISILRRLNKHVNPDLISGEAMDIYFTLLPISEIPPEEMKRMLTLKTGRLIRFAAECGSLIGLSTSKFTNRSVQQVGDFAEKAALAFQLKDDLLGLYADEINLGKPVGSDLREGKRTLLFATAANRLKDKDLDYFLDKLGNKNLSSTDIEKIGKLIANCGALNEIESLITILIKEAQETLNTFPENEFRNLLSDWINFTVNRIF